MAAMHTWEPLPMSDRPGDIAVPGRRLRVPGGWLYQVSFDEMSTTEMSEQPDYRRRGWHPPVFVPDPEAR